ncbi:MAG: 4Fe-4S dicluster domain-containing protein [Thermoprotei archaeon]
MKSIITVKKDIINDIVELGGKGIFKCYQCGACTATCAISEGMFISFRRAIKYAQLGLEDKLKGDLVPWLCNVHGDCIKACPRDANPCEILASLRRYQSILYDWTGISRWWYFSSLKRKLAIITAIIGLSIIGFLALFGSIISSYMSQSMFVNLPQLIPIGIGIVLISLTFLISNAYRMYKFVGGGKDYKIGFIETVKRSLLFWIKSEYDALKVSDKRIRILEHVFILVGLGLFLLLSLLYLLLPSIYQAYPYSYVLTISRYITSGFLIIGAGLPFVKRVVDLPNIHWYYKLFRHSTDWIAIGLVFSIAFTGMLLNIFNDLHLYAFSYLIYVLHIGLVVPFLVLEVPFGKHTHWLYKVIANYVGARKGLVRGEMIE